MITFKPLEKSDFDLLNSWMNIDFVSKWYEKRKPMYVNVEKKYKHTTSEVVPIDSFMVFYNDVPIGYIQHYRIADYPKYAKCVEMPNNIVGIDMFIGDKYYLYKGYGKEIIETFLKEKIFTQAEIETCMVGLEEDNNAGRRMYEKAGFSFLKTVDCNDHEEYIMIKRKSKDSVVYEGDQVAKKRVI